MSDGFTFYFDFSSPYGYLAAQRVDAVAARQGREVVWRPMLLGAVFKRIGGQPLVEIPMKGDYARHDIPRSARLLGVPFVFPPSFPFASIAAARAVYWLDAQDPAAARALAKAIYQAAFGLGQDILSAERVIAIAAGLGHDPDSVAAALQAPEVKERLRQEVEDAIALGVFGSPFFLVDGEPFWGNDRLAEVERWLETGGW